MQNIGAVNVLIILILATLEGQDRTRAILEQTPLGDMCFLLDQLLDLPVDRLGKLEWILLVAGGGLSVE